MKMANSLEEDTNLPTKAKMYRVETFIIPNNNKNEIFRSTEELDIKSNGQVDENVNEIDDVKIANRSMNRSKLDDTNEECNDGDEGTSMGKVLNELQVIAKVLTIENILSIPGNPTFDEIPIRGCSHAIKSFDKINLDSLNIDINNGVKIDEHKSQFSTEETQVNEASKTSMETRNYLDSDETVTTRTKPTFELEEPIYECIFEMDEYDSNAKNSNHQMKMDENLSESTGNGTPQARTITEIEDPIYDLPYSNCSFETNSNGSSSGRPNTKSRTAHSSLEQSRTEDALFKHPKILKNKYREKSKSYDFLPLPKPPLRTSSLKSIDEGYEPEEFCYHGYKNGCTVATQSPEEVSQEIFKENWLQRMESLRQRDALLRDKEVALQDRERLLFKKEKELRILERLVREKMQKAELYLKRCRNTQNLDSQQLEKGRDLELGTSNRSGKSNFHDNKFSKQSDEPPYEYGRVQSSGNRGNKLFENDGNIYFRSSCSSGESINTQNKLDSQRNIESRISHCSAESKMSGDSNGSKSSKNSKGSGNPTYSRPCNNPKPPENTENTNVLQKLCSSEVSEHFKRCRTSAVGLKNPQIIENTKLSTSLINSRSTDGSNNTESNHLENRTLKNPSNSRSSLVTQSVNCHDFDFRSNAKGWIPDNQIGRFSAYSSCRSRVKPKISYDDLDSTLSADIGDSSFIITSKKFDPEIFKRPYVFSRSASERRVKNSQNFNFPIFKAIDERRSHIDLEGEKVLRKVNENILVSQNDDTKFHNYGLIDDKTDRNSIKNHKKSDENYVSDNKRFSYLNLEENNKVFKRINDSSTKDRPISWNEEANEWLQKKRHAYNLLTKRMVTENFENKENFGSDMTVGKSDKSSKKKDGKGKGKRFTIFR